VVVYFGDHQRWHHLVWGRFPIFTLELVFAAVHVSGLSRSVASLFNPPYTGHDPSTSGGLSSSSGSSIVPVSVKQTRQKRTKSDEDVWDWPDAKIIRTNLDLAGVILTPNSVIQKIA